MAKMSGRNGRSRAVILPARSVRVEIEAILTSFGFDPFGPQRRWEVLKYRHIPAPSRLARSQMASNLGGGFNAS
jgi:hypothetical protein